MQHSIWKMYSTIRNGLLTRKKSVLQPHKAICIDVLKVMYKEGYINGFRKLSGQSDKIEIFFKYNNGNPAITKLSALSKPSCRLYVRVESLWKLNTSLQTLIISTPRGIFSDKECRKLHLGGEILCVLQ
uniref:30S ribosomal protein S8 n=1 Tax=Microchloropsis salina TaxID=2511165 RepID=T1R848_9STRA|nr:30S ribosomal protein S8 [Microchloropsis salina]AGI48942.1 30S ribosomal protein S8 [Microchloropsis salina]